MKNNKISVIMGIFNCDKYLKESIESLLSQTYSNFEIIMCDDGSTDDTYKIANEFVNKYPNKIKLLKNDKNMGLNYTLNLCLKEAEGTYIARQDGDDISLPNRLKKEVEILDSNEQYSLVSTNMIFFDESGDWGQSHVKELPSKYDFVKSTPFCHAPCMIRKSVFNDVGGYTVEKELLRVEDLHLWFKIYEKGYIGYNIQQALYKMRDDRDAYKRRKFKYRINEARVKFKGFKSLNIPFKYYIFILRPIIVGLLPRFIYDIVHRRNLRVIYK
ncbi:MAG: glycosyltransferase [Clostridia bacterium]